MFGPINHGLCGDPVLVFPKRPTKGAKICGKEIYVTNVGEASVMAQEMVEIEGGFRRFTGVLFVSQVLTRQWFARKMCKWAERVVPTVLASPA